MKKIFIPLALIFSSLPLFSQLFSELNFGEQGWALELSNFDSLTIEKVEVINEVTKDTAVLSESQLDELNNFQLIVTDNDDYSKALNFKNEKIKFSIKLNNTIINGYDFSAYPNFLPNNTFSLVFLDSVLLQNNNYRQLGCEKFDYVGIATQSIGYENKIEDCFSRVKGKMMDNGIVLTNKVFIIDCAWDVETMNDTLYTDESGNFIFETWNNYIGYYYDHCCSAMFERNLLMIKFPNDQYRDRYAILPQEYLLPGINNIDISDIEANINDLKASTALTCSPNPASNYVKVEYSIVETASWKDCSIIISNNQGQTVLQTPIKTPQGEVEIKLPSTLAKGMYYCSVAYKGQAVKTVQLLISGKF